MGFVKAGRPAGMVDGNIDKQARPPGVDGIHQFDELLQRGGLGVEFGQCRVNSSEAQGRVWASEPAHAGIGGGCRMNGQQLDDPAAQVTDNKIQFRDQVPEGPPTAG